MHPMSPLFCNELALTASQEDLTCWAGLQGEVVGLGKLGARSRASALYRLAAPPDSAATVTASLRAASLDTALGERGATPGSFLAHLGAVPKQQVWMQLGMQLLGALSADVHWQHWALAMRLRSSLCCTPQRH